MMTQHRSSKKSYEDKLPFYLALMIAKLDILPGHLHEWRRGKMRHCICSRIEGVTDRRALDLSSELEKYWRNK
jgi:hypothetical protein